MSDHHIRIIGGKFRGRKVPVIESLGLRPTPNRVRETLFNWLQFDITGMQTLDLFAGSGILSFEALSRGAKKATLVEKEKKAFQIIKKTSDFIPQESIKIYQQDALNFIKLQPLNPYSLIFLDPPFGTPLLHEALSLLKDKVSDDCVLYIESDKELSEALFGLIPIREQKASSVHFGLYHFKPE